MNERIKELAEQAGYTPLPGFDFANELQEVFLKKFAELIVADCINVLDPNGEYTAIYSHTPQPGELRKVLSQTEYGQMLSANLIKTHFGIE